MAPITIVALLLMAACICSAEPLLRGNANFTKPNRRELRGECGTGNPIDDCWACDPNWASHRQRLADCAVGFGKNAIGGRNGPIYVVTDAGNDNPTTPVPGTLRYGVIQEEPLWIIFAHDMNIQLEEELIMNSFKTVDGRGANVHIAFGACFTVQFVEHIIIHGLHIHDCKSTGPARVRSSPSHVGDRGRADGDGVSIFGSSNIWVDHNFLSNCADGLVDAIQGSTAITISNNYFTEHDKVMLMGAHDGDTQDDSMQVTVALNHFGPGLNQRMPRCRRGSFHVVNNFYESWGIYAIGGSADPTINSESNHYNAPNSENCKEVTKRMSGGWTSWNWRSSGDLFLNQAFFVSSGAGMSSPLYKRAISYSAIPVSQVPSATASAGPL